MGNSRRFVLEPETPTISTIDLAAEVERGLFASPKKLSCRFFYDETGSSLFEQICALPEYYLTRAENEILERHAREIVARVPKESVLVELGSGSARKTDHLIEAQLLRSEQARFVPIDISRSALEHSAQRLMQTWPGLSIHAIAAEYQDGLALLDRRVSGPRLVLWLGSNVGNYDRSAAGAFLARLSARMRAHDRLLLGVDLRKDKGVLERAYDDAQGVTARFNLNLLSRINFELAGHFDLDSFRHVALYDESAGRIEMHLESTAVQEVAIDELNRRVRFERGERIHTEDSYKYSLEELETLARDGRMQIESTWLDRAARFSLSLLKPAELGAG